MADLVILNGPEIGKTLRIREGVSYLGRSADNDIRIEDKTISRKHLKIESVKGKHFVTDLSSRNGTFYSGKYVVPDHEVQVKEGVPLAIGMTVVCFGVGYGKQVVPFLDTVTLIRKRGKEDGVSEGLRGSVKHKWEELLSEVSLALKGSGTLKDILGEVLEHIFSHLKRIDRGAFVLADPDTSQISETICKTSNSNKETTACFSDEVVQTVLETGKPVIFSKGYTDERSGPLGTLEVDKIESVMCVPLNNGSRLAGAMYIDSLKRPDGFLKEDLLILLDIAQRVALTVEADQFAEELAEVAKSLSGDERF